MAGKKERILVRAEGRELEWELAPLDTSPCTLACPTRINARGYVSLIADGRFADALALIRERNPFPGVCGRICTRPCEAACRRGDFDDPIAICALKRFVFDDEMKRGIDPATRIDAYRKERIAVIGAGPAGLSAAHELAKLGYPVTVFDSAVKPGGMMNLIPDYRLPELVVKREARAILDSGIELVTGAIYGKDITRKSLKRRGFKALLLATGAARRTWMLDAARIEGKLHALDFLDAARKEAGGEKRGKGLPGGETVVVAGSGMLALDAARTAVRVGYRSVTLLVGRSRALTPMLSGDLAAAEREGIAITYLSSPARLLKRGGKLAGIRCARLEETAPDPTGRRGIVVKETGSFDLETDIFIDAHSRGVDTRWIGREVKLELSPAGTVSVDPLTMAVGMEGVFAAGDVVSGPRSVVEAIASGQKAAMGIHHYLGGERIRFDIPREFESARREYTLDRTPETARARAAMPMEDARTRRKSFVEVEKGFAKSTALIEAQRCLRCGPCSECTSCVDICMQKDVQIEVPDDFMLTARAGRDFWSLGIERAVLEFGDERVEAAVKRTIARVDPQSCIGCGRCENICGFSAVHVESYPGGRFIARVDELACKGCGNCLPVCPTGAMDQVNFERKQLLEAFSGIEPSATKVVFACRWSRPGALDLPGHVLVIDTMCTGRLTPALIVEAIRRGSAGVMICGCRLEQCHYRFGRENSVAMIQQAKDVLRLLGLNPEAVLETSCEPVNFHKVVRTWAGRGRPASGK